jgi:hypothetical protein
MAIIRVGDVAAEFSVAIGHANATAPLQELTTFGSVGITMDFSAGDQIQFTIAGRSAEAQFVDELASDIWLSGAIAQRFRIISVGQDWNEDGDDRIAVTAVGYKRLLNQRHVPPGGLTYANIDQGDIVWDFWAKTQAQPFGSWGVTKGVSATGVLRDRTYVEGDNLGNLADNLQNVVNGLWWTVDVNRVYSAKLPSSFGIIATPLQMGANIRSMSRAAAGDSFANVVYGDAGEGTVPVWGQEADLATDPRGRWERAFGWPTVSVQATLQEHVDGALQEVNTPFAAWKCVLEPARWITDTHLLPGDMAVLVVPATTAAPIGDAQGKVVVQVTETVVSFDADGALSVTIACIERSVAVPGE